MMNVYDDDERREDELEWWDNLTDGQRNGLANAWQRVAVKRSVPSSRYLHPALDSPTFRSVARLVPQSLLANDNSNKNIATYRLLTPAYAVYYSPSVSPLHTTNGRTNIHSTKGLLDPGTPCVLCRKTISGDAINAECRHEQKNRWWWGADVESRYEEQRIWVQ